MTCLNKFIQKAQFGIDFEIENMIEDHCQRSPKLIGVSTVLICIFGPNMEILTLTGGVLYSVDKLKKGWIFTFQFNLTLKVRVNHPTIQ